jgi:4-hydroxythreonine-4-phosphate dehydrogenase
MRRSGETTAPPRRIVVTLGDPRGIGPEVMREAVRSAIAEIPADSFLILGHEGSDPGLAPFEAMGSWDGSEPGAGIVTAAAICRGVELALGGSVGAIVTGPAHKPSLRAAGWNVPGQTEMLGNLTGTADVGMLMCAEETALGGALRVLLATTHLPLREIFSRLSRDLLLRQSRLLVRALERDWAIPRPRIGLCALNPHAGDAGLFGTEEEEIFRPVVAQLREEGIRAQGPLPADTVFHRAILGEMDAVVAPYHDVGMAALKSVGFGTGVNVTLGLPFVRTSPDHGTAFDIAGSGRADPGSARAAVRLAAELMRHRFDTPGRPG